MISADDLATFMEDKETMTTPQPMSVKEFVKLMAQMKQEDARVEKQLFVSEAARKDLLLRKQRVRDQNRRDHLDVISAKESQRETLLRRQRLRDRVAVARGADANRKQFDEERRERAFRALMAKKAEREKASPPPPPKTPHQRREDDIRRRTERQAKHENELQKRKFEHDALPTAPVNRDNGPLLFTGIFGHTPILIRPKRKQARWEKEQHFDQGVL